MKDSKYSTKNSSSLNLENCTANNLLFSSLAILAIFLNTKLGLSEHSATAIYHYFYFASYFFGIIGAIIADNWLGRFKTLFFGMSVLGGIGNLLLAIGTIASLSYLIK